MKLQNKSVVLKRIEREQLAEWVQSGGGVRACAAKAGISKSVLYKLLDEGHAHPASIAKLRPLIASAKIIELVCAEFNITEAELMEKKPDNETAQAKKAAIYLLRKRTTLCRQAIADIFRYASIRLVHREVARVQEMILHNDDGMRTYIQRIETHLNAWR